MEDKTVIVIIALIVLAYLMSIALFLGYDGTLLAGVIGILGVVVGVPAGFKAKERMLATSS